MEYKTLEDIIKNPKFVSTLIKYEEDRGIEPSETPLDAAKNFLSDYRYMQSNTLGAFGFVNYVKSIDEEDPQNLEYKQNLGKLYQAVDEEVDEIFGEDATLGETLSGIGQYTGYALIDPINILGLGAGKAVGVAAARPLIKGLVNKALATRTGRAALGGAGAAIIDAPVSATMEYQAQEAEKELDIRDETDYGDVALAGTIGGVVSAIPAAGMAAAFDPLKKTRAIKEQSEKLLESTPQGEAGKKANLNEIAEKDKLVGLYVENVEEAVDKVPGEYDSMGRVVEVDKEGNVVVEFYAKNPKDVEFPRIQKTYDKKDVKALTQKVSDDRAAEYINESGKFFDPKEIEKGKDLFKQKLRELDPELAKSPAGEDQIESAFNIGLNPELMARVNRAADDMVVQDPSLMRLVDKRARPSEKVAAILEKTDPGKLPENLRFAIEKQGLTAQEFANAARADISIAAMNLGKQAQIPFTKLDGVAKRATALSDQDLARVIDARNTQLREAQASEKLGAAVDIWRSLLVTQPATTARNIAGSLSLVPGESLRIFLDRMFKGIDLKLQGIDPETVNVPKTLLSRDITDLTFRLAKPEESMELLRMIAREFNEVDQKILSVFDDRLGKSSADDSQVYKAFNGLSRFANFFNGVQDRAFKSAAFLSDLDGQIKLGRNRGLIPEGLDSIEDVLANNRLDVLSEEMVSRSLDAAYKLTFQNRRAGDRLLIGGGKINQLQDLINASPVFKMAIPFPNFLANSVVYILNRMGMGAIKGIVRGSQVYKGRSAAGRQASVEDRIKLSQINKEIQSLSGKQPTEEINAKLGELTDSKNTLLQNFGEQERKLNDLKDGIIETAEMGVLFSVALALRENLGGGEWYQLKDIDGESRDFRPMFPLAPFLFLADAYIRYRDDLPTSPRAFQEGSEALFGVSARAGAFGKLSRELEKAIAGEYTQDTAMRLGSAVGSIFGSMMGGFATPLRPLEDVTKTTGDDERRKFQDRRQQQNFLENAGIASEEATRANPFLFAFFDEVVKNVVRGTPFEKGVLGETEEIYDPTTGEVRRSSAVPLKKQYSGVASAGKVSEVQEELARVGVDMRKITEYSKTPKYDNTFNAIVGTLSDEITSKFIVSPEYLNATPEIQKRMLENLYRDDTTDGLTEDRKRELRRLGGVNTSIRQIARNTIKENLPVLYELHRFEDKASNPDIAEALEQVRLSRPGENVSLRYVNELKDPEGAARLKETLDQVMAAYDELQLLTKIAPKKAVTGTR